MEHIDAAAHEAREMDEVVARLRFRFPGTSEEQIQALVTEARQNFDGRPIRSFVPVLVERSVSAALAALPSRGAAKGDRISH